MKAYFLESPRQIVAKEIPTPEPGQGEIRVKLSKIGICGSDVHLFLGHRLLAKPTVIGHEGLGFIDKIGEGVVGRNIGERVVIEPNFPCNHCPYCNSGRGNICINKRVVGLTENGCFAEYLVLPAQYAWPIPSNISDLDAVCIEPAAVAYHALFSSKALPGDTIAVLGIGAIGLLLTHLALSLGYRVFVSEINQEKLNKAIKIGALPAQVVGNLETQANFLSNIWQENNVKAVFECAGSEFTATLAAEAAPRGSEIVLVGLSEKKASFTPLKIAREGITIVPSIIYQHPFDFQRVIQLITSKIFKPASIISCFEPLDNLQNALEMASGGGQTKIILNI
jgi:L-iditol 2-dehydrogenase